MYVAYGWSDDLWRLLDHMIGIGGVNVKGRKRGSGKRCQLLEGLDLLTAVCCSVRGTLLKWHDVHTRNACPVCLGFRTAMYSSSHQCCLLHSASG